MKLYISLLILVYKDAEKLPGPTSNLDLRLRKKRFAHKVWVSIYNI